MSPPPPVGSGQLLNFVQLRFCIGEKIRLDALEVFGRNNVKPYNTMVKFFNERCSSYRYKVTDFNSVTQDMQDRKDLLAQQARLDWFKATGHVNVATDTHPILVSRCKFRLTPTSITWGAAGLATPAIAMLEISVSSIRPGHHEHIHTLALQVIGAQL